MPTLELQDVKRTPLCLLRGAERFMHPLRLPRRVRTQFMQSRILRILALSCLIAVGMPSPIGAGQTQPMSIDESGFQIIGGIPQWITIRGMDRRKPVLLLVHGGPGDVQSQFASTYATLQREYVIVQWDQRGAGRTLEHAGS